MPLSLTTISTFKQYFSDIATSHVDIDELKFGNEEVIKTANRSSLQPKPLWVQEYDKFNFEAATVDHIYTKKEITLSYFKVAASELFADEQQAQEECELVIKQVIAKMLRDKRDLKIVTDVSGFSGKVGTYTIGSTKYCGCELTLTIKENAGFVYDPVKWT